MKALTPQELRIGNTLWYETGEQEGVLEATIDWRDLQWISTDPKGFNLVHTPIPLTEELLVRLGFEKKTIFRFDKSPIALTIAYNGLHLTVFEYGEGPYGYSKQIYTGDRPIKFVHEVQNIYHSLTGKELELKL